jgi:DNA-directed RNA polymerase subunit RPC12/RpoP
MPGGGIAEILRGAEGGTSGVNVGAIERKLNEIADAHKLKATAQAVAALGHDDDGPGRESVDAVTKVVQTAQTLAEMQSEREKMAREEADALRQRLDELEARLRDGRREERREQTDALTAMATMLTGVLAESRQNQSEMTKLVLELLARHQQPPSDPLRDELAQTALRMAFSRQDPDEEVAKRLRLAQQVAEAMGFSRGQGNITNLDQYRLVKEMELAAKRLELEQQKMDRQLGVEEKKAEHISQGLARVAEAFAQRAPTGQAPSGQGLAGTRVQRYRCQDCGTLAMFDKPVADYECPGCKARVFVGGAGAPPVAPGAASPPETAGE